MAGFEVAIYGRFWGGHRGVRAAVETVIAAALIDDDIAVRISITHAFAAQVAPGEGLRMRDHPCDAQPAEDHLWVLGRFRQNEEHIASFLRFSTKVIAADSPGRWVTPEVRVVIDPASSATAFASLNALESPRYVDIALHR